jgi:hypothetical protein
MDRLEMTPVISKRFPARNPMMVSKSYDARDYNG